jgi:uncharacterized membrane protein YgcG
VAFFGFGRGVGIGMGFGFGTMGWVPLAPYETFYPWYGRGYYGGYGRTSAMMSQVNIASVYRNARFGNGVSGIASADFVRGQTGRAMAVGQASVVRGQVPVAPVAESLRLSDRPVRMTTANRSLPATFATRRQAPAVQRIPFEQQRRGMEQMVQRSFSGSAGMQSPSGWRHVGEPGNAGVNQGSNWRQIGAAPNRGPGSAVATQQNGPRSGGSWQQYPSRTTEAIRINPPIVRERSAPQYVGNRGSASRPAASAPRTSSTGGGSHSSGGGSHSSGGGSSHGGNGHTR